MRVLFAVVAAALVVSTTHAVIFNDSPMLEGAEHMYRSEWDLSNTDVENEEHMLTLYSRFRKHFKGEEETNLSLEGESLARFESFKDNVRFMKSENARQSAFQLGLTPFADMSWEEFSSQYLSPMPEDFTAGTEKHVMSGESLPESKDWSKVTGSPRNQGRCGSCWAFAAMNSLAAHTAIKTKKSHEDLSVEQLLDCMQTPASKCSGGWPMSAFQFARDGVASESSYKYQCGSGLNDKCKNSSCNKSVPAVTRTTGNGGVALSNEDQVMDALATKGPLAFAMAVTRHFQHYTFGVLSEDDLCAHQHPNHAMTLTGYNKRFAIFGSTPYYNIQNSWGRMWGELGYARVIRGKNFCGIGNNAAYPLV